MTLTAEQRDGLNLAINEAALLGFEVDPARRLAGGTFRILTLPETGSMPDDRRVQILFSPVGRVAASLRHGRWDDASADAVPVTLGDVQEVVQSFETRDVSGRRFFDAHEDALERWGDRVSLDWRSGDDGLAHSLTLVLHGAEDRTFEICVWFDTLQVRSPEGAPIALDAFVAGARRWWRGLQSGDPRTAGHGIFPGLPSFEVECPHCGRAFGLAGAQAHEKTADCAHCGRAFDNPRFGDFAVPCGKCGALNGWPLSQLRGQRLRCDACGAWIEGPGVVPK